MKPTFKLIAVTALFLVFSACGKNQGDDAKKNTKDDCSDVHWSHHEGADGPANWQNLCDGFADCGGQAQSPIDIVTKDAAADADLSAPEFRYGTSPVAIINNGHTVQFNISGDNEVTLNGKVYKLLQFHFHAKSEHTIDGKQYPLEVHFVHKHSDSDFAVLGVMYEKGAENALLKKYLAHFPKTKGDYQADESIDLASLFPEDKSYYHYNGSLTTPPCSEVVSWYVLKTPVTASAEQLDAFAEILDNNYRPVMPLNNRTVKVFNQ